MHTYSKGFTVIELLIVVIMVTALAMAAVPSFMGALRKSRRAEAISALAELQHAQERWRANNPAYTGDLSFSNGLGLSRTTASGHYGIEVLTIDPEGDGYEARASALPDGPQWGDAQCLNLFVRLKEGSYAYGAQGMNQTSPDYDDAHRCWNR